MILKLKLAVTSIFHFGETPAAIYGIPQFPVWNSGDPLLPLVLSIVIGDLASEPVDDHIVGSVPSLVPVSALDIGHHDGAVV